MPAVFNGKKNPTPTTQTKKKEETQEDPYTFSMLIVNCLLVPVKVNTLCSGFPYAPAVW